MGYTTTEDISTMEVDSIWKYNEKDLDSVDTPHQPIQAIFIFPW